MGLDFRDKFVEPQNMSSFEQWAWDKWEIRPEDLWDKVFGVSIAAIFGAVVLTVATVCLVRFARKKWRERVVCDKPKKRAPKIKGKKICLVKIPMTETTVDETEIITLPKGEALPTPQRDGYRFLGWFYDRTLQSPIMPFDELKDETILYAKWVKEGE